MAELSVPHQRQRLGWTVGMTVRRVPERTVMRAAQAFVVEAADRPGPLKAALERKSVLGEGTILASPQRIIAEAELTNLGDTEHDRALNILSRLFIKGGDGLLVFDERTQGVVIAAAKLTTDPEMARTRGLHAALGCLVASLDAQGRPSFPPAPGHPIAPGQA